MKIKFKQGLAGPAYAYSSGDIKDMPKEKAIKLCKAGIAVPCKNKKAEKKVLSPIENTSKFPKFTGGGWYKLSNGEKIQGKENAIEAEKKVGDN